MRLLFLLLVVPAVASSQARPASGHLDITRLRPSVDTVVSWRVADGARTRTSTAVRTVARAGDGWLIVVDHRSAEGGDRTVDSTRLGADLRLLRKAVWATTDSAVVTWRAGRLAGWATPPGEERRVIDTVLGRPVYPDDGLAPWLWTLLPLSEGLEAAIETVSPWSGALRSVRYRVLRRDGGAWVVASDRLEPYGIHAEAWIDPGTRRILRGRAWSDDGTEYLTEYR